MNTIKEPTLYVFLNNESKFPSWFKLSKNDSITIPFSRRFSDKYRFNYNGKYIGDDNNYKFYLNEIGVTDIEKNGTFLIMLSIQPVLKHNSSIYVKKLLLTYEILCPIIQYPESYFND